MPPLVPLALRHRTAFLARVRSEFRLSRDGFHGPAHWARVARNGRLLCGREPRASRRVVALFALLHDLRRRDEGTDLAHGPRAADFIREIAADHLRLDAGELDRLCDACIGHSGGDTSRDLTIAACWDADRLDLGRVGKRVDPRFLSLPAAREPALIAWAHSQAPAARTDRDSRLHPDPIACVDGRSQARRPGRPALVISSARFTPRSLRSTAMESAMGVKDAVKALVDRLPDDCTLDDIIDRLYELERAGDEQAPDLTPEQRAELARRLETLDRDPGRLIPWAEFRRELEREE